MSTVALAGDWHGNTRWARARIAEVAANGVALILHLGDFGIWPGASGRVYVDQLEDACAEHGVGIRVTPGNHEDWGSLTRLWAGPEHSGQPLHVSKHIAILPRGHRFTLEGRSFLSLGGAPSVDLEYRSRNKDWWAEEAIRPDDVAAVVEGGYADVMLAHDAPLAPYEVPRVAHIRNEKEGGWPDHALAYARAGAELMHEAFLGVRPRLFTHGSDLAPRRSGARSVADLAPIWHHPPSRPTATGRHRRLGGPAPPSPVESKRAPIRRRMRALTCEKVEHRRLELLTSALQRQRSTN